MGVFWYEADQVALAISQRFEEDFEEIQSYANSLRGTPLEDPISGSRPSGFSEEDLPSDLLGFWLAKRSLATIETLDQHLLDELEDVCDIWSVDDSLSMWEEYENNGAWRLGWKNWVRRPRPANIPLPKCKSCDSEQWPSQVSAFQPLNKEGTRWILGAYESSFLGWLSGELGTTGWWQLLGLHEDQVDYYNLLVELPNSISNTNIYLIPTQVQPDSNPFF